MSYCILSFCGGGIRGLFSAGILKRLAEQFSGVTSKANLLAGTSTGADIVSLILDEMPPAEIYEFYKAAPKAFENPGTDPSKPAYDIGSLVKAQKVLHPKNPTLNALSRPVLITAFNVGSDKANWEPLLLHNLPNSKTGDTLLVDAVVASSAMPGMYGSYAGMIDGGFVHHDPTVFAIAAAVSNGYALDEITAICIDTGLMGNWIASDTSNWGAQQWQQGDGNPLNCAPPRLINGSVSPILNVSLNGTSTTLMPQVSAMLLGSRYAHLNATFDRIIPENDIKPADLDYLEKEGAKVDLTAALKVLNDYWP